MKHQAISSNIKHQHRKHVEFVRLRKDFGEMDIQNDYILYHIIILGTSYSIHMSDFL